MSGLAEVADRLDALARLPGVGAAAEAAREACARLRFHEALRRRTPEAAAESRVRGAWASAALDGADMPVGRVRDLMRGAAAWSASPGPVERVAQGVVHATAESERVVSVVRSAPMQALARLHVAAAAGLLPADEVGRPRTGSRQPQDLSELGAAPVGAELPQRLAQLARLVSAVAVPGVSGPVVAVLVHAEVATVRPFVVGNGAVARALQRALVQAGGVDPTGVAVPEVGHWAAGLAAYHGALAAYRTGSAAGVALWLRHGLGALVAGAEEGERVCASVLAGRLA